MGQTCHLKISNINAAPDKLLVNEPLALIATSSLRTCKSTVMVVQEITKTKEQAFSE